MQGEGEVLLKARVYYKRRFSIIDCEKNALSLPLVSMSIMMEILYLKMFCIFAKSIGEGGRAIEELHCSCVLVLQGQETIRKSQ